MNRIDSRLNELKAQNKKAFITYITAGLPTLKGSADIIKAQYEAGVDIIELGVPFSDPVADGPVIQAASHKAIQAGVNLSSVFEIVKEVRKDCEVPITFLLYYNTILYYGIDNFIKKCIETGVDGMIVPDLPYEETFEINASIAANEGAPYLIPLVSPVSKERIPMILKEAKGFVYCVSSMGVTGQAANFHKDVKEYLNNVRTVSKVPVMMGFGIRTPKDIEVFKDNIDGCIVGTHLIKIMEESNYNIEEIKKYVSNFKAEL